VGSTKAKGDVTCRKDDKGILHITNNPPAGKAELSPPVESGPQEELSLKARLEQAKVSLAAVQDAGPLTKGEQSKVEQSAFSIPTSPRPSSQVQARRKKDGTIVITNVVPAKVSPDGIPEALKPILAEAAWHYGLPLPLIRALIRVESNFNPVAVSNKGAMGLMQLMPGTASDLGVRDPYCPRENVLAGCRYFRYLLDNFDQSLPLALAAYNAGSQRVVDAGYRVPGIKETQEFVTNVLENYYRAVQQRGYAGVQGFSDRRGSIIPASLRERTVGSISREAAPPPCQHALQAASPLTPPPSPASETPSRPSQQAGAAPPGLRPLTSITPKSEVTCRQDDKGILHITNIPPAKEAAPPYFEADGEEELALKARLELAKVLLASVQDAGPLTKGEQSKVEQSAAAIPTSPRPSSQVRAQRKKDGTIVITNLDPPKSPPEKIPKVLKPILTEAAWHYGLPVPLIRALIKVESNFNSAAVSPKGAMGLMQLMPGTASDLEVRDPHCPRENVLAGCRYFRYLLDTFKQSLPLALAAYNAGPHRVVNAGYRVPEIKETQEFVTDVLENYYRNVHHTLRF